MPVLRLGALGFLRGMARLKSVGFFFILATLAETIIPRSEIWLFSSGTFGVVTTAIEQ